MMGCLGKIPTHVAPNDLILLVRPVRPSIVPVAAYPSYSRSWRLAMKRRVMLAAVLGAAAWASAPQSANAFGGKLFGRAKGTAPAAAACVAPSEGTVVAAADACAAPSVVSAAPAVAATDSCGAVSAGVSYVTQSVTKYRTETVSKQVPVTVMKMVPKTETYTYTEAVPVTTVTKQTVTEYKQVPKTETFSYTVMQNQTVTEPRTVTEYQTVAKQVPYTYTEQVPVTTVTKQTVTE